MVPAVHMAGFDQQVVRKAAPASLPTTFVQSDNSPSCAPAGNKTENFSPTTGEGTLLLTKPHSKTLPGKGSVCEFGGVLLFRLDGVGSSCANLGVGGS